MSQRDEPLDSGFVSDIPKSRALFEQLRQFHWEYYSALAYLRSRVYDSLKTSLRDRAKPFVFSKWQRAVKYKYALEPLGTNGSLVDPGGRFNIGEIDTTRYPVFPALYVASDKGTALAELLGRTTSGTLLTPEEVALTKPDSIAAVSVSGHLEAVIDVCDGSDLGAFVALIKGFRLPSRLTSEARRLHFSIEIITTVPKLIEVLHAPNWREWPTLYDTPAASQIFGRISLDAQLDGILYRSVLTEKPSLAVFHQNFQNSSSYIELDDPAPPELVRRRLDSSNCNPRV
ncbi:MAG TPA: RES family NAD+ phosphorylase [Candidatus Bathyarchaeia archaeon]|nr:RES family NAD+ phosphorylase [Candidatus Bathyarchaeia archaeon]